MSTPCYTVYFVSDSTGITAEALGRSLLSQFPDAQFQCHHIPFINTIDKAQVFINRIKHEHTETDALPIVFATMPNLEIDLLLKQAPCHYYEVFNSFVNQLSADTKLSPVNKPGLRHALLNQKNYDLRIDIVDYALVHDDALSLQNLALADVILLGVSRSGKTPTCLYLAMHFGLRAANYPLTEDDFRRQDLPQAIKNNIDKVLALTIMPNRLSQIRQKRSPGSRYATLSECQSELRQAQKIFNRYKLEVLDTTSSSIEELATKIISFLSTKTTQHFTMRDEP